MGRFCRLGLICRYMTALPLVSCFVIWWCVSWGWSHCLHLMRCSWALPWTTACFPLVTVLGSVLQGPVPLAVALVGLLQLLPCNYQPPVPRSPLEVRSPPLDLAQPPLDLALPPLEMVWYEVPLGGLVVGFVALSPLLLRILLPLSS
jgi:hypothetical protein